MNPPREPLAADRGQPVHLPPGPPLPKPVQGMMFLASRRGTMRALRRRYGRSYSIHVPIFGSVPYGSNVC